MIKNTVTYELDESVGYGERAVFEKKIREFVSEINQMQYCKIWINIEKKKKKKGFLSWIGLLK
jgi:hypothetical protein